MQLWAKKRPIEGRGQPYEFIMDFENENYKYTAMDSLDRDVYQECLVVKNNRCVAYVEFEKPLVKVKRR